MKLSFQPSSENWYAEEISLSIHLLRCYAEDVEKQVSNSIKRFEEERNYHEIDYGEEVAVIEEHRGLADDSWNLPLLFEVDLPNLQRKSAFVTLLSFLENELNNLCRLLKRERNLTLAFSDLSGNGIERASSYLKKVVQLAWNQGNDWQEMLKFRDIRNYIVHNDGKVEISDKNQSLINYLISAPYFEGDVNLLKEKEEIQDKSWKIIIKEGCLSHVLTTFDAIFKELDELVNSSK